MSVLVCFYGLVTLWRTADWSSLWWAYSQSFGPNHITIGSNILSKMYILFFFKLWKYFFVQLCSKRWPDRAGAAATWPCSRCAGSTAPGVVMVRNFYGGSDEGVYDDGDQVEVGEPPVLKLLTEVLDAHLGAGWAGGRWSHLSQNTQTAYQAPLLLLYFLVEHFVFT